MQREECIRCPRVSRWSRVVASSSSQALFRALESGADLPRINRNVPSVQSMRIEKQRSTFHVDQSIDAGVLELVGDPIRESDREACEVGSVQNRK
jgi:hypothetical protein